MVVQQNFAHWFWKQQRDREYCCGNPHGISGFRVTVAWRRLWPTAWSSDGRDLEIAKETGRTLLACFFGKGRQVRQQRGYSTSLNDEIKAAIGKHGL
jgi:hypothetical protein